MSNPYVGWLPQLGISENRAPINYPLISQNFRYEHIVNI